MSSERVISVARDFSRTPGPRYTSQGHWSGEEFRKRLEQELRRHERLIVDLDGTRGYGSSFLDEAFGGLVREGVLTREDALRRLEIRSTQDPTYKTEAEQAIRVAERAA
jgi:hypothetical protein